MTASTNTADCKLVKYKDTPPALSRTLPDSWGGLGRGVLHLDAKRCNLCAFLVNLFSDFAAAGAFS
ncbi:hypothetical protein NIES2130_13615 [Scytonema sp. HK-05]|nr:hypothetical protein NIES2130_13615 [Scytonema sp. HK-05]